MSSSSFSCSLADVSTAWPQTPPLPMGVFAYTTKREVPLHPPPANGNQTQAQHPGAWTQSTYPKQTLKNSRGLCSHRAPPQGSHTHMHQYIQADVQLDRRHTLNDVPNKAQIQGETERQRPIQTLMGGSLHNRTYMCCVHWPTSCRPSSPPQ